MLDDVPGAVELRYPIAGPWMSLAASTCIDDGAGGCNIPMSVIRTAVIILDGLGQAAGLGIVLEAILLPTSSATAGRPAPAVHPTPQSVDPDAPPAPPSEKRRDSEPKNLFYLPMPAPVGMTGVGLHWMGTF